MRYQYTADKNVFRCLQKVSLLTAGSLRYSPATGQPRRKPAGQMYSASGAVRSAVADQQIGDEAVMRRRR